MKGVQGMEYIARLLLIYSLIFFLSYYGINLYDKTKTQYDLANNIIGGLIFAVIIMFTTITAFESNIPYIPNGRFLLIGCASFYFGPLAGIISATFSSILVTYLYESNLMNLIIVQAFNILLYYVAALMVRKLRRNPRFYEIILTILVFNSTLSYLTVILSDQRAFGFEEIQPVYMLAPIEALLVTALLRITYRERERIELIQSLEKNGHELSSKKSEIEALYEVAAANEEKIKHNNNELSHYEERIEYLAFHENQTGFFNGEKLLERLRDQKGEGPNSLSAMLIIGIVAVEKLEKTIGIVLMDTLHYLVGIEIMTFFEDISEGQMFSIGKGKYSILIQNEEDKSKAAEIYQSLNKRFLDPFIINTVELKVNIAAGGIDFSDKAKPEEWIERCEFAFYHASVGDLEEGKIVWSGKELMEKKAKELQIEKALYKAIEKNEFYLAYQPQYDNNRMLIGAEALLRWKHDEMGEIPPGLFIPIAEKNGLIDSIGKIVVQNVCDFVDRHRDLYDILSIKLPLSINASFLELINPNFTIRFLEILEKYNIPPEFIHLEITESEVSMHYKELTQNLKHLQESGIRIELDDFGTGYSSLNHLGTMPVHTIKIDKSFIDHILTDNKIGDLVEMIIDFAHRFNLRVIAEGVEEEEQFLWLKEKQCDAYQGYYFAKPMKEELFMDHILQKK